MAMARPVTRMRMMAPIRFDRSASNLKNVQPCENADIGVQIQKSVLLSPFPITSTIPPKDCPYTIYKPFLFALYLPPAFLSAMMNLDNSFAAVGLHSGRKHRDQADFKLPQVLSQDCVPFDPSENEYAVGVRCCQSSKRDSQLTSF
jgi:hypothetical protein